MPSLTNENHPLTVLSRKPIKSLKLNSIVLIGKTIRGVHDISIYVFPISAVI